MKITTNICLPLKRKTTQKAQYHACASSALILGDVSLLNQEQTFKLLSCHFNILNFEVYDGDSKDKTINEHAVKDCPVFMAKRSSRLPSVLERKEDEEAHDDDNDEGSLKSCRFELTTIDLSKKSINDHSKTERLTRKYFNEYFKGSVKIPSVLISFILGMSHNGMELLIGKRMNKKTKKLLVPLRISSDSNKGRLTDGQTNGHEILDCSLKVQDCSINCLEYIFKCDTKFLEYLLALSKSFILSLVTFVLIPVLISLSNNDPFNWSLVDVIDG
uniref:Uncharacterized protein n=1 Tax=Glossina palpalis gambiensis TaxID=67801 RepID=A0A1B0B6H7_9MUSC